MVSKYSKFAVAAAIAGTCGYASAATLLVTAGGGSTVYSLEGAAANGATNNFDAKVAVTFDKNLRTGDEIRFTMSKGRFESLAAGQLSVSCATNGLIISSNRVSTSAAEITLGVTGTSSGETTAGTTCTFASMAVAVDSFTLGDVTVGGGVFDAGGNSYDAFTSATGGSKIASAGSQYSSISVSTALNGVVDFQDSLGYGFAATDGALTGVAGKTDQLTITVATRDTANSFTGTASIQFALAADSGKTFGFLCTGTPSNVLNSSLATGKVGTSSGAEFTVNSACTSISVNDDLALGASESVNIGFGSSQATPSVGVNIEPMTFPSLVATVKIGSSVVASSASLTVGSWTSNGSTVQIPYMPVNTTDGASKIDPVIIISNRSAATGSITATVRDEDGNSCTISDSVLGSIAGLRTKSIGGAIRDAIAGSTCADLGGVEKVAITLTVTLPSGSTEVYSGYTVGGGSRVTVVNSSNGYRYTP